MRKTVFALGLLLAAAVSQASDLSIGLSDKVVAVDFEASSKTSPLKMAIGGLHHSDNGDMGYVGLQVSQKVNRDLEAAIGFRGIGLYNDVKNATAIALGGSVDYALPMVQKVYVGGHGWYAPNVVSYGDSENYRDLGASLTVRLMENASIFGGYRLVRVNYEHHRDLKVFEGVEAGIKLSF